MWLRFVSRLESYGAIPKYPFFQFGNSIRWSFASHTGMLGLLAMLAVAPGEFVALAQRADVAVMQLAEEDCPIVDVVRSETNVDRAGVMPPRFEPLVEIEAELVAKLCQGLSQCAILDPFANALFRNLEVHRVMERDA